MFSLRNTAYCFRPVPLTIRAARFAKISPHAFGQRALMHHGFADSVTWWSLIDAGSQTCH